MRGSSISARSRRASSLLPSRMGSLGGNPVSPGASGDDHLAGKDFVFDGKSRLDISFSWCADVGVVPTNSSAALDSDFNFINLERNSFNFLE